MPTTSQTAQVTVDLERTIAPISPLLFSGFAEHMGRCIYEGIYDPASPHADARGLRRDVLAALRELRLGSVRYPGGNFLSGYRWLDGVGPREQRPRRRELAWRSIETNQFGTDEFLAFCAELGTLPMLGVNMGTGTIDEAAALIEYCNAPTGTRYADLRAANGHPAPYGVRYWCLGNEMDGPWQIGHLDALDYARKAREAAKMLRWHDQEAALILCGSSTSTMPTYPEWDRVVLEQCWDQVDYLSLHYYANNDDDDTPSFLALSAQFEAHIDALAGLLRYVKALRRSSREVYLSWDEWNIWYKNKQMDGAWQEAPHLIEEVYNLEDALVAAQWLNVFLRRADVLKIACLAQIVNVIAPILTTRDGLLKQTIFYPFQMVSSRARGESLDLLVRAPSSDTRRFGPMPLLDAAGSYDAETGAASLFLVNRSLRDPLPVTVRWQGAAPALVRDIAQLSGDDPKLANSFARPDAVVARRLADLRPDGASLELLLPPLSFTALTAEV